LDRTACLVLDIHLGRMTGFDLQEQLAADRPPALLDMPVQDTSC